MDKRLEHILVKRFPGIFKDYRKDSRESCMYWGMECGDGWFKIIYELCEKLEQYNIIASQVKEKFGGLRFYIRGVETNYDEIYNIIHKTEEKSFETCETCGKPGTIRTGSWVYVSCGYCKKIFEEGHRPYRNPEKFADVYNELVEEGFIEQTETEKDGK